MEYDWIGKNVYFVNYLGSLGLCSRRTLHCTQIIQGIGRIDRDLRPLIALDPLHGYERDLSEHLHILKHCDDHTAFAKRFPKSAWDLQQ